MDQQMKAALAAGVAGGYVLGRTKKGRVALTVATVVMGRRLGPRRGGGEDGPEEADRDRRTSLGGRAGGQVVEAGRSALATVVDRRFDAFVDLLREHTPGTADGGPQSEDAEDADGREAEGAGAEGAGAEDADDARGTEGVEGAEDDGGTGAGRKPPSGRRPTRSAGDGRRTARDEPADRMSGQAEKADRVKRRAAPPREAAPERRTGGERPAPERKKTAARRSAARSDGKR